MINTVVLADEQASFRQMLGFLLEQEGPYKVVAEVGNGYEALNACRRLKPHFLILDLALPELSGVEVLRSIRAELPASRAIVYTGAINRVLLSSALQERPHGFVHKKDSLATFRDALRAVAAGCGYVTAFATSIFDEPRPLPNPASLLSDRERAIVQMIAEGLSNKEMSTRLFIAPKTIEYHRSRLMRKIETRDIAGVIRYAYLNGMVSTPPR